LSAGLYDALTKKMSATSLSSAYTIYNDKQLQNQYDDYSDTIDDWDDKIDTYTERYVKQFSAMETALSKLNSNSSYLSSMLS
jgi:flagellar hook-associated protein 2